MANEIIDLQNEFVYKGQRYRLPGSGGGSSEPGQPGADGITPHIDVVTGHWFIGDEDTGIDAHGLQGNSGVASADGVVVINNTDDGGYIIEEVVEGQTITKVAVLSAEAGKQLALKAIPGAGTFADAYEKARANNVVFPWFLRDVDENGNPIEKMIWHNGYRKFVDAIGAEVVGQKNGFTVKVNAACDLRVFTANTIYAPVYVKTHKLTKGENNISFEDFPWNGKDLMSISFCDSDTTTQNKNYVEELDFGGMYLNVNQTNLSDYGSLKKVNRLVSRMLSWGAFLWDNPSLEEVQFSGETAEVDQARCLGGCRSLRKADLRGFSPSYSTGGSLQMSFGVNYGLTAYALEYLDIRDIDTANVVNIKYVLQYAVSLKTLIIGSFTNSAISDISNQENALLNVTDCVLICTTSEPPVLKNCTFNGDTPNDEHSADWDWLAYTETVGGVTETKCHFSAIYVPTNAVTAYKSNVYVTGGVEGNTGWSRWADLIHDIAGTEYEDLI